MKPILNIENLTKIYGNVPSQTKALNGITYIKKIVGNPGRTAYLEFLFQRFTVAETIRISDNYTLS